MGSDGRMKADPASEDDDDVVDTGSAQDHATSVVAEQHKDVDDNDETSHERAPQVWHECGQNWFMSHEGSAGHAQRTTLGMSTAPGDLASRGVGQRRRDEGIRIDQIVIPQDHELKVTSQR